MKKINLGISGCMGRMGQQLIKSSKNSTLSISSTSAKPGKSFLDGLGNGLGYGGILISVAFFRELLGNGTIYGYTVIPDSFYSVGYQNMGLMVLSPGAFIILGLIVWIQRIFSGIKEE